MSILTKILQYQMAQTSRSSPKYFVPMALVAVPFLASSALASMPEFREVPCTENPFKPPICGGTFYHADFVDLDNDNDLDAIIGLTNGTIAYFENVGTASTPIFEQRFDNRNPFSEVKVSYNVSPNLVDLDNDGDLDAVIGGENGVSYYENVGNAIEPQFEQRTKHPFNEVNLGLSYTTTSLRIIDLDNDGDFDAIIMAQDKISYYENVGSATKPQFEERPEHPLSQVLSYDIPDLIDLDNDGDLDLFKGNRDGTVNYYENVGSAIEPQFKESSNLLNGVSVSNRLRATFWLPVFFSLVDLDNDGDFDAIIGNSSGEVMYYENVGSPTKPQFEELPEHPLSGMIAEGSAIPNLIDLDNDGDLDTVFLDTGLFDIQNEYKFYENVGNANRPQFEKRLEHPLSNLNMDLNAFPSLVDLDNDGDKDVVIGHRNGKVSYYENVGSATKPSFKEDTEHPISQMLKEVDVSNMGADNQAFPNLVDLDNDGDLDIVVGRGDGLVSYYENVGSATKPQFEERREHPLTGVNVGSDAVPSLIDLDNDGDLDAFIGQGDDGQVSYYKNVGSPTKPQFEKHLEHSLNRVNVDGTAFPSLVDLDNDGDLDAVIGSSRSGLITYYENVSNATEPQFEKYPEHPLNGENVTTLIDLDEDGDWDAIINGQVIYENIGTANQPLFERCTKTLNPFCQIKVGSQTPLAPSAPPPLVDLDNDGDLDAIIGNHDSQINYYENVGNITEPKFEERFKYPLKGIIGMPSFADLDKDGDWDAVLGHQNGLVSYYKNIGNTTKPQFEKRLEYLFEELSMKFSLFPSLVDLDSDGDWDMFISHGSGSIASGAFSSLINYYENVDNTTELQTELQFKPPQFLSGIGVPVSFIDLDNDSDLDMATSDNSGTVSYYENIGNAKQPQFGENKIKPDFLNEVRGVPNFVDLDDDGDQDAVTNYYGQVNYYENVGSASQPQFEQRLEHPLEEHLLDMVKMVNLYNVIDIDNDGDLDEVLLVDIDNDGDKDVFNGNDYYVNTEGHVLPPNRALPKGGLYSSSREVNLVCLDCETIYYTLDGSTPTTESLVFTEPFNLAESTTLKFLTVDAKGQQSKIITEKYVFDTKPPQITITSPIDRRTMVDIADIRGTADDAGGSGLRRIELNIFSAPMSLIGNSQADFSETILWLPVKYKKNWFYDLSAVSFPVGTYEIKARAFDNAGNMSTDTITVFRATQASTDLFLKLDSTTLLGGKSLNATGTLVSRRFPAIEEDLKDQEIKLVITAPDGSTWTETTQIQSNIGQFEFKDLSGFDQEGAYSFVAQFAETDLLTQADSEAQSVLVGQSAGYAVIVMGQTARGEGLEAHNKTTNRIYKTLKERGFEKENIFYFNPTPNQEVCKTQNGQQQCIEIDGRPTVADFVNQVAGLVDRINGSPAPFYLILVNHGDQDGNFYINDPDLESVKPKMWADWLDAVEAGLNEKALAKPRFVLLGYCYSGKTLESLTKPGRIVISSAAADEVSYKGLKEADDIRTGEYFMEELFGYLGRGESFQTAFQNATARTELFTRRGGSSANEANSNRFNDEAVQHPLISINGDEGRNDLSAIQLETNNQVRQADQDEVANPLDLSNLYLGAGAEYDTNFVGNPAEIKSVTETLYLGPDETSADLFLTVNNVRSVKYAFVNVRLPSTELTTTIAPQTDHKYVVQQQINELEEVQLWCNDKDQRCQRTADDKDNATNLFYEPGKYELYYFVTDNETHDISKMWRSVVYKNYEGNQSPEPVELLSPNDGSEEQAMTLLFSWKATIDPEGDVTYTLIIAEDAEFEYEVYRQEELTQTQRLVLPGAVALIDGSRLELEDDTEYYWKVEAVDNFGAFSTSAVWRFKTNYTNGCPASSSNAGINANTICSPGKILFCPMKQCPNFCFCR